MIQVSARVSLPLPRRVWLPSWKPDTAWNGSTHTCTYLYHLHVHYMTLLRMDVYYIRNMWSKKCNKITLNNLHQAGPNKPIVERRCEDAGYIDARHWEVKRFTTFAKK